MPLDLQPYLLRVLEDGVVFPLDGHAGRQVDIALASMTNRSLTEEVSADRFRSDLYYLIATATVFIPLSRAVGENVKFLADCFAFQASLCLSKPLRLSISEIFRSDCANPKPFPYGQEI